MGHRLLNVGVPFSVRAPRVNDPDSPEATVKTRPAGARSARDKALFRFLRTQVSPHLGAEEAQTSRTVNAAIANGDLAPLFRLSAQEKQTLLELLDRRLSEFRGRLDADSIVRLTDVLVPPLPGDERRRAPGAPAR